MAQAKAAAAQKEHDAALVGRGEGVESGGCVFGWVAGSEGGKVGDGQGRRGTRHSWWAGGWVGWRRRGGG